MMKQVTTGTGRVLIAVAILVVLCLVGLTVAQDSKGPGSPAKVVEVDLSKLSPELAKQLTEALQKIKDQVKPIRLSEAIDLAEKSAGGRAVKAEVDGAGADTEFAITVLTGDGSRKLLTLDARGKVLTQATPGPRKGPPPGKGKEKRP